MWTHVIIITQFQPIETDIQAKKIYVMVFNIKSKFADESIYF